METRELDAIGIGNALKARVCKLVEGLAHKDVEQCEAEFVLMLSRVQELVDRKRQMEGAKTDTRDLVTELLFSRLRRAMHLLLQSEEQVAEQRAAEWVMGALFSITTLTEFAEAFDRALLAKTHTNEDFNFASRTDFLSLEEVLQMLAAGKHTGCLSLEKADNRLDLYLRDGRIAFLDPHHMIRRVIPADDPMHQREIPVAAVTEAQQRRAATGWPVLLTLVEGGHFRGRQARDVLRLFGREALFDFMIAEEPFVFFFRRLEDLPDFVRDFEIRLGVTSVLLEGSKRLDDWKQMQRMFPDSSQPVEPRADMYARMADAALDVTELKLLSMINGEIAPRGLAPALGLPLFDVYQLLGRLARAGILVAPGGDAEVARVQYSVAESMQEAFAALDANDDAHVRSQALDQVLGGAGDLDESLPPDDDDLEYVDEPEGGDGDDRRQALEQFFAATDAGDDDDDDGEGHDHGRGRDDAAGGSDDGQGLGRGFLDMLGRRRSRR